jgi:exopolysaccharide production protein ExoZ
MSTDPGFAPHRRIRSRLTSLEAGRGLAALLVVFYHSWIHCREAYGDFALGHIFAFGHAGVDFFFVLSGFIIFEAHRDDIGNAKRLSHYIERRVTRIYLVYWIILALTLLAASLSSKAFPTAYHIVTSFFLVPTRLDPVMVDAWTLQHEMLFYTIFALIILNRRLGMIVFALWLAVIVAARFIPVQTDSGFVLKLSSSFNFEFFLGMGAAYLGHGWKVPAPRLLVPFGVIGFFTMGAAEDAAWVDNWSIFVHLGYGAAAALVVIGLVAGEQHAGLKAPAVLVRLGGASYSLYLVHVLSIGAIWQIMLRLRLDGALPVWAAYSILITGAVISGLLCNAILEKPAIAFARRLIARPTAAAPSLAG